MKHIKRVTVTKAYYGNNNEDPSGLLAMIFNFVLDLAQVKDKAHSNPY